MALIDIRQRFVEETGRYDLVVDDVTWANNGADRYITEGQKFIDRGANVHTGVWNSVSRTYNLESAGAFYTLLDRARSIQRVFVNDAESRTELVKLSYVDFVRKYSTPVSGIESGRPLEYAIGMLRAEDLTYLHHFAQFFDHAIIDPGETDCIIFSPPTSKEYVLEVWGLFYSQQLVNDADENWWTREYPEILVKAACYYHEVYHRNTQGAKDWLIPLREELSELDFDIVESDIIDAYRVRDV